MNGPAPTEVAVAGAGLTGALAAIRLARLGHTVTVYERRDDPRATRRHEGRSINLAMSTRGLDALEHAGLAEAVRAGGVAMHGRMIHARDGALAHQPYSADPGKHLLSVDRDRLNEVLLDAAGEEPGVTLRFAHKIVDFALDDDTLRVEHQGETRTVSHPVVIGADGAFSAVRSRLQRTDRFRYEQDYLEHGYKELTIAAGPDGSPRIDPHALHIWPRGGHMMIALANPDGSFTCTLFWPFDGPDGFERIDTAAEVEAVFARDFADAAVLIPDLAEQYLRNPTSSLVTVRCSPWHVRGRALVLGDAAHAVVPFYGQGANAALEDVTILVDELHRHADWEPAFRAFFADRKPDADALAELALDNFVEMRDKVSSRRFRVESALRRRAHALFPQRFVTLYEMVTFSRTPYAEAVARAERQDRMIIRTAGIALAVLVLAVVLTGLLLWS
jgi:kynurenine 3-monooxygenase